MSMSIRSLAQLHLGKALMISISTKLIEQEKTSIGRLIIVKHNFISGFNDRGVVILTVIRLLEAVVLYCRSLLAASSTVAECGVSDSMSIGVKCLAQLQQGTRL
jgi:hypothetical protein